MVERTCRDSVYNQMRERERERERERGDRTLSFEEALPLIIYQDLVTFLLMFAL
jgi:hypothetical protein